MADWLNDDTVIRQLRTLYREIRDMPRKTRKQNAKIAVFFINGVRVIEEGYYARQEKTASGKEPSD